MGVKEILWRTYYYIYTVPFEKFWSNLLAIKRYLDNQLIVCLKSIKNGNQIR